MALNSHTSGGYWHSILTPRGATGTGARDTGATGMTPIYLYSYKKDETQINCKNRLIVLLNTK